MLPRTLPRIGRASPCRSFSPLVVRLRAYHGSSTSISDPPTQPGSHPSVTLAHPHDPGAAQQTSNTANSGSGQAQETSTAAQSSSLPPPSEPSPAEDPSVNSTPPVPVVPFAYNHASDPSGTHTTLPSPHQTPQSSSYASPPFDTHRFFAALEKTFLSPTARSLMGATRGLLIDRVGRVRRDAVTVKDLESVSFPSSDAMSRD